FPRQFRRAGLPSRCLHRQKIGHLTQCDHTRQTKGSGEGDNRERRFRVRETDVIGGSCPQFEIAEKAKRGFQKLGDGKEHVAYERHSDQIRRRRGAPFSEPQSWISLHELWVRNEVPVSRCWLHATAWSHACWTAALKSACS